MGRSLDAAVGASSEPGTDALTEKELEERNREEDENGQREEEQKHDKQRRHDRKKRSENETSRRRGNRSDSATPTSSDSDSGPRRNSQRTTTKANKQRFKQKTASNDSSCSSPLADDAQEETLANARQGNGYHSASTAAAAAAAAATATTRATKATRNNVKSSRSRSKKRGEAEDNSGLPRTPTNHTGNGKSKTNGLASNSSSSASISTNNKGPLQKSPAIFQRPTAEHQRRQIQRAGRSLAAEDTWYPVPARWYRRWKRAVLWVDGVEDISDDDKDNCVNELIAAECSASSTDITDSDLLNDSRESIDQGETAVGGIDLPPLNCVKLLDAPSRKLWERTCADVGSDTDAAANVIEQDLTLDMLLDEGADYELIPESVWSLLISWYGGGPALPRKVICTGLRGLAVELYPLQLKVCRVAESGVFDDASAVSLKTSKALTIRHLEKKAARLLGFAKSDEVRFWNLYDVENPFLISGRSSTLEDCTLQMGQMLALEKKDREVWPRDKMETVDKPSVRRQIGRYVSSFFARDKGGQSHDQQVTPASRSSSSSSIGNSGNGDAKYPRKDNFVLGSGLVGLSNLGNTCFMNSALQLLSHTPTLRDYFVRGQDKSEYNRSNPLGMKGQMAEEFGSLMRQLWSLKKQDLSVAPRDMKRVVSKYAPQFNGFGQHDSQELLVFVLDGLHEDLNRITKKPYVEDPEYDPLVAEEQLAREAWKRHLERNKSIIVDTFMGQLKSRLVCPDCGAVSITFDPFMYLSLPLPGQHTEDVGIEITVLFCSWLPPNLIDVEEPRHAHDDEIAARKRASAITRGRSRKLPVRYVVRVPRNACIIDLKHALAAESGGAVDAEACVIADVHNSKVYKWLENGRSIGGISSRDDIWCFCLATDAIIAAHDATSSVPLRRPSTRNDWLLVQAIHRRPSVRSVRAHPSLFDTPLVLHHPRRVSGRWLYEAIWRVVGRYVPCWVDKHGEDIEQWKRWSDQNEVRIAEQKRRASAGEGSENELGNQDDVDPLPVVSEKCPQPRTHSSGGYPFVLRHVQRQGEGCAKCGKSSCIGCEFLCVGQDLRFRIDGDKHALAIDWEPEVLDEFWDEDAADEIYEHSSIERWNVELERRSNSNNDRVSLDECLKLFTTNEKLSRNDMWYCPKCKEHVQADKKFDIWSLPEVLVVHFKRFSAAGGMRSKVSKLIEFPLDDLDLSPWVSGPIDPENRPVYDLAAVSNHSGGLGGGHYTTCARNLNLTHTGDEWYLFDDSRVFSTKAASIVTRAAYVCLYVRKSSDRAQKSKTTASRRHKKGTSKDKSSSDREILRSEVGIAERPTVESSCEVAQSDDSAQNLSKF